MSLRPPRASARTRRPRLRRSPRRRPASARSRRAPRGPRRPRRPRQARRRQSQLRRRPRPRSLPRRARTPRASPRKAAVVLRQVARAARIRRARRRCGSWALATKPSLRWPSAASTLSSQSRSRACRSCSRDSTSSDRQRRVRVVVITAAAAAAIQSAWRQRAGARAGTGKTLAFALGLIELMLREIGAKKPAHGRKPRTIVLAPTRELAMQVTRVFEETAPRLSVCCVYGGAPFPPQGAQKPAREPTRRAARTLTVRPLAQRRTCAAAWISWSARADA